jgi:hypothetical protein
LPANDPPSTPGPPAVSDPTTPPAPAEEAGAGWPEEGAQKATEADEWPENGSQKAEVGGRPPQSPPNGDNLGSPPGVPSTSGSRPEDIGQP